MQAGVRAPLTFPPHHLAERAWGLRIRSCICAVRMCAASLLQHDSPATLPRNTRSRILAVRRACIGAKPQTISPGDAVTHATRPCVGADLMASTMQGHVVVIKSRAASLRLHPLERHRHGRPRCYVGNSPAESNTMTSRHSAAGTHSQVAPVPAATKHPRPPGLTGWGCSPPAQVPRP